MGHADQQGGQAQLAWSADKAQHDKNFATVFALWDWMFGTLYVTTPTPENIRFGTGEQDHQRYLTVYSLIVTPFVETGRKVLMKCQRKAVLGASGRAGR